MENGMKVVLFFGVICLLSFGMYKAVVSIRNQNVYETMGKMCVEITSAMKEEIENNATYTDVYCYYMPYAVPEELEGKTETLCICEYKIANSSEILTTQVLGVK